jgi:hypothetical protein
MDYFLRPWKPKQKQKPELESEPESEQKPEPIPKIWWFLENEYDFDTTDPDFKSGDEIETFNYKKLEKVKPY